MTEPMINKKSAEKAIKKALSELETVVAENEHITGKWMKVVQPYDGEPVLVNGVPLLYCSSCRFSVLEKNGLHIVMQIPTKYCPMCGALMCE